MTRQSLLVGVLCCLCLLCAGTAAAGAVTAGEETAVPGDAVTAGNQPTPDNTTAVVQESGVDDQQDADIPDPVRVGDGQTGTTAGGSTGNTPVIQGDHIVNRTPGTLGKIEVTYNVTIPESVVDFYAYLNSSFTVPFSVTGTDGFSYEANKSRWAASSPQGTETTASLTYTIEANTTSSFGGFNTVETTDWALTWGTQLGVRVGWRYFDPAPEYEGTASVDGSGYAATGRPRAFLGPVSTSQQSAAGQTITLVVPDAATPSRPVGTVLDELTDSAEYLQIGDRDPQTDVFIAPDLIRGGGRGGGSAYWVQENSLSTVHLHEYIHTRQAWVDGDLPANEDSTVEWITEGSADYYQGFLAWNVTGTYSDQQFYNYVSTSADANKVLQDSDSQSTEDKNYNKGRRIIAALDIRLRQQTGGNATFQTVFEHLNTQDGDFSYSDLRSKVVNLTNESTGSWLDNYVQTTAAPSIPQDIAAAYDPASAGLANLTVAGNGPNATITEGDDATIAVAVTNTGNTSSSFDVELAIGTAQQTGSTATLSTGATETVTFTGVTDGLAAGSYDLTLSTTDDKVTGGLTVQTPPEFRVSNLQPQSTTVVNGTVVDISADVENTGDQQGTQTLGLTVGSISQTQTETLGAGANTTVTFTVDTGMLGPGSYSHAIASANDSASGTLTVDPPEPATFAVRIESTTAPVTEGQRLSVNATVENTGDVSDTQTVELDAGALGTNATTVSLGAGVSRNLALAVDTTRGDNGTYTVTVGSANDTATAATTVQAPAEFAVTVTGTTTPVVGDPLSVTAQVTNVGEVSATQSVELDAGRLGTNATTVALDGGNATTVALDVPTADGDYGNYTVTVGSANQTASASARVTLPTLERNQPRDRDGDGLYEDVDGDGGLDILDVQALFNNLNSNAVQNNRGAFKFQPRVEELTILDVQGLFNELEE